MLPESLVKGKPTKYENDCNGNTEFGDVNHDWNNRGSLSLVFFL